MLLTSRRGACFLGTALAAVTAASAATDPYTGPVFKPTADCQFTTGSSFVSLRSKYRDGGTVLRTVIPRWDESIPATTAFRGDTLADMGTVAYRYAFSGLDATLPTDFAGQFTVTKAQVVVYKGAIGAPVVSSRIETDAATRTQPMWASTTTWGLAATSTWSVVVTTTGIQKQTATGPDSAATVVQLCSMKVLSNVYAPPPITVGP